MNPTIVLKFGGTSVGSPESIRGVASILKDQENAIVVFSAFSGTTNVLEAFCKYLFAGEKENALKLIVQEEERYRAIIENLFERKDSFLEIKSLVKERFLYIRNFTQKIFNPVFEKRVMAQGELLSSLILQYFFESEGVKSKMLSALLFMKINEQSEPDLSCIEDRLREELINVPEGNIMITQGYICQNVLGEIDNLKRGGSDYTASLIGAALQVKEIQIWTDIDGVHNNDPRVVEDTYPIEELSYDEAAELAYFGAKILHPQSILPAQKRGVPVSLKNTMEPLAKGTMISASTSNNQGRFTAVAGKDGIIAIKIKSARMLMSYGFMRHVFEVFERYSTSIDMITTSEVAVSLTIDDDRCLTGIVEELEKYGQVEVDRNQSIICVVGNFVSESIGSAHEVFSALKEISIRMISYGGSRHNISILVNEEDKNSALRCLNNSLFNN